MTRRIKRANAKTVTVVLIFVAVLGTLFVGTLQKICFHRCWLTTLAPARATFLAAHRETAVAPYDVRRKSVGRWGIGLTCKHCGRQSCVVGA